MALQPILMICQEMDSCAARIYEKLIKGCVDLPELRQMLEHIAKEERRHVEFWSSLQGRLEASTFGFVQHELEKIRSNLTVIMERVTALDQLIQEPPYTTEEILEAIVMLEYFLLHEAMMEILDIGQDLPGFVGPAVEYGEHLNQVLDVIKKFSSTTSSVYYLAEATRQLWKKDNEGRELAHLDTLTGVLNRRSFMQRADMYLKHALRYKTSFSLIRIDIDDLKSINAKYSHAVGDQVLRGLAEYITERIRETDVLGRTGGEEFDLAVLADLPHEVNFMADRLRKGIAESSLTEDKNLSVTISVGMAVVPDMERKISLGEMMKKADEAMYMAKKAGKNRIRAARW